MKTAQSTNRNFRKLALQDRIDRIVRPNEAELEAKRNARFGRLNVAPAFDLTAQVRLSEARGDLRVEFARRIAAGSI